MKISVSIVNYKVPELLLQCIDSVESALQNIESEIIITDNHSEDDSQKQILSRFPNVKWIQNNENKGFGKAHNKAIENANGKYILILNPDTVLPEKIFKELIEFSENIENLGIVGVQMINDKGSFLPESKRNIPTIWNALEKELGLNFLKPEKQYYANQINKAEVSEAEVLSGAFMWMPKIVFEKIGGFDERFFMYAEDIDLSIKTLENGYKNYYKGNTIITHLKGKSAEKNKESKRHFYQTMIQFIDKHYSNPIEKNIYKILVKLASFKNKLTS